jgi:hypothetical protein
MDVRGLKLLALGHAAAALGVVGLVIVVTSGCRELGLTSRVLWRIPAPDGTVMAVCQEIPQLDGPGFEIRLESPDGSPLRRLYEIGDGDPCSELAWSPDGRTLAVLSAHVARIRFVDADWALKQAAAPAAHWSWPQVDLSTEADLRMGKNLQFIGSREIELTVCSYSVLETQRTRERRCTSPEIRKQILVPLPVRTGRSAAPPLQGGG